MEAALAILQEGKPTRMLDLAPEDDRMLQGLESAFVEACIVCVQCGRRTCG